MAIFRFFKMAAAAILDYRNFKFLTARMVKKIELRHRGYFVEIALTAAEIWRLLQDASRPPSWICDAFLGPPTNGIWWSLSLCKIWLESMR